MSNNRSKNSKPGQSPQASTASDNAAATTANAKDSHAAATKTATKAAATTPDENSSKTDTPSDDMSRKNRKNTPPKTANNNAPANQKAAEPAPEKNNPTSNEKPTNNGQANNDSAKPKTNGQANNKSTDTPKHNESNKKADSATTSKPLNQQTTAHPPKKSGGLVPKAALLLGALGTGIGVYSFDQIRTLKSQDNTSALVAKLNAAEAKIAELSARNTDALEQKIAALSGDASDLKNGSSRVNERLSAIEQTQAGLSKTLQGDLNKTLDTRLNEVNALLQKVKQIELTQEGLTQNLNQVTAAGEAVTATGMAKQEVGYLLRMADYKIESEGDTTGAAGLLKIAEDKLLLINKGQVDPLISAIRQKLTQLAGVQPIDPDAIIRDLKTVSRDIPKLVAKTHVQASASSEADMKKAATSGDKGILDSIGEVIASGVKYTPNDPSKIDISAETVVIEKRLMQADIRTAELAVRSQNQVLLAESLRSVRDSLDKYFAVDATATAIGKVLADIEQRKLETVLPDLSSLVKQFEGRQ